MLSLYRDALRLRRDIAGDTDGGEMTWHSSTEDVLLFSRGQAFACLVNMSTSAPTPVPEGWEVSLSSGEVQDGAVPPDTAVWLRR